MPPQLKAHFARHEFIKIKSTVIQMLSDGYTKKFIYQHFIQNSEITMSYRTFSQYAQKLHISSCTLTSNLAASTAKPPLGARPPLLRDIPKGEADKPYAYKANPDAERLLKLHVKHE